MAAEDYLRVLETMREDPKVITKSRNALSKGTSVHAGLESLIKQPALSVNDYRISHCDRIKIPDAGLARLADSQRLFPYPEQVESYFKDLAAVQQGMDQTSFETLRPLVDGLVTPLTTSLRVDAIMFQNKIRRDVPVTLCNLTGSATQSNRPTIMGLRMYPQLMNGFIYYSKAKTHIRLVSYSGGEVDLRMKSSADGETMLNVVSKLRPRELPILL
ncbi:MAG: hypothetical protein LQ346_008854 [Caloplaca aetnensis]|nr:MAG: hypothetical protein LQ346_008854 [Caloplaca aetnensis]